MIYTHLKIWTHEGETWHTLSCPGTRELSMAAFVCQRDIAKTIAWAKSQNMKIEDLRQ